MVVPISLAVGLVRLRWRFPGERFDGRIEIGSVPLHDHSNHVAFEVALPAKAGLLAGVESVSVVAVARGTRAGVLVGRHLFERDAATRALILDAHIAGAIDPSLARGVCGVHRSILGIVRRGWNV